MAVTHLICQGFTGFDESAEVSSQSSLN